MRLPLTNPDDLSSIDMDRFKDMVDAFIEGGGTYFDTAFVYHDGASETALREALVERYPRDSYTIATKCLAFAAPDEETAKSNLPTSLERLGVDYVDYYLLHNVGGKRTAKFDEYGMWEYAAEMKKKGLIKNLGFSIHDDAESLDRLLTEHPDMDFVQIQVNYLDREDPVIQSKALLEVAQKHDMPVIIMEPVRGGRLAGDLPERVARIFEEANPQLSRASWALRFCYELPNVITTLSGMSTTEQAEQNMEFAARATSGMLSEEEKAQIIAAGDKMRAAISIPCTACDYCSVCPQDIAISKIFAIRNQEQLDGDSVKMVNDYRALGEHDASHCVQCGLCVEQCPQHIEIFEELAKIAKRFS
jgi:predicted aldo/keto reductase-like oxidoreductase